MEKQRMNRLNWKLHNMTSQQILQADLLDILFEGRNKAYGAYLLRRGYNMHLVKAIGITMSLLLLLFFFNGSEKKQLASAAKDADGYRVVDVVPALPKNEPPKIKTPPAVQQPVKTDVLLDRIKIVDDPITPVATQNSLEDATPGATRIDGPPVVGPQPPPTPPAATGGGTGETIIEKPEPPLPSRSPQFPGGTAAWLKFLERYLAPPADLNPGEKRSVLVRFSVDEEGVVTNFAVVQSGGTDFDNEVIRVLRKMPRWLPAVQNGKPVAVSFTQPVTFVAPQE